MRSLRLVATGALLTGLVCAALRAGPSSSESVASVACTPHALALAFDGSLRLQSIDSFGCAGDWAFLWATVGTGPRETGVTEVVRYYPTTAAWTFVSRLRWCKPSLLPELVYRQGCFSN